MPLCKVQQKFVFKSSFLAKCLQGSIRLLRCSFTDNYLRLVFFIRKFKAEEEVMGEKCFKVPDMFQNDYIVLFPSTFEWKLSLRKIKPWPVLSLCTLNTSQHLKKQAASICLHAQQLYLSMPRMLTSDAFMSNGSLLTAFKGRRAVFLSYKISVSRLPSPLFTTAAP